VLVQLLDKWYIFLSQGSRVLSEPVQALMAGQNLPGLTALLLGLLGGLAPCQVTANAGAIAYVTQASQAKRPLWPSVGAFLGGKAAVYLVLGFLAAMLGLTVPTPVLAFMRRLMGPMMMLMGLYFAGVLRLSGGMSASMTEWLTACMPRRIPPAFWLGFAFSLAFCPTMAVIFFGGLVPLVASEQGGMLLPLLFAVGTAVPVILWATALSAGREASRRWIRSVRSWDRYVRLGVAVLLLALGLNDTLLYWFT
jgi:cytochrome c biogenesis protein CcdA